MSAPSRDDRYDCGNDDAPIGKDSNEYAGGHLTIDLAALQNNYRYLAAAAPGGCAAVVKADAYGIGVARAVPALVSAGCRVFFVAHIHEAAAVATLLPDDATLYVLNGAPPGSEDVFRATGAMPVLNSIQQARRWQRFCEGSNRPGPAALQIDTGMSRLGIDPSEVGALAHDASFRRAVPLQMVMSHLACADTPDAPANEQQLQAFLAAASQLPGVPRSLANSGGVLMGAPYCMDVARPGIALYGGAPCGDGFNPVQPVIALKAQILQIRTIASGTGVGYGLAFTAPGPLRLATLSIGYADGWPRALGGRGAAYHGNQRLPIVGRISMDSLSVDISAVAPDMLNEGDWLELIGPHQSIDTVAADAGTIAYEIMTRIGRRYHVVVLEGHSYAAGPDL
jgi:alanine racemase